MKQIRNRLTYANVMSSLAVFLVIGGGAAFAAVSNIAPNSVGTPQLKKNAVKTGKVAFEAIRAGKLSKNAVPTNRLRDKAVATNKIADLAVTTGQLFDESVASGKIAKDAVLTDKIADDAVTNGKIAANAVTTGKIAANAVNNAKLANNAVNSAKIQNGQVRAADLGAITEVQVNGAVENNDNENLDANCPAGTRVISGGGGINLLGPPAGVAVTASLRQSNGWRIIVRNDSGVQRSIFVEAQCLQG